jgi:hypothetical protein
MWERGFSGVLQGVLSRKQSSSRPVSVGNPNVIAYDMKKEEETEA